MNRVQFNQKARQLLASHEKFVKRKNEIVKESNGIFSRYKYPVLTGQHAPIHWRYDLDYKTNPNLLERIGVNAAFNVGATEYQGRILLFARVEGADRKSFFAVAESRNGIDNFRFWDYPIMMPEIPGNPDTNVYDIRVTQHEDGWYYGIFCTERKDTEAPRGDLSSAIAQAGIARTKDFLTWERLPDLKTASPQQRNVVLHPELVGGKYAFYTRPQDGFISAGSGGGIGWGLAESMLGATIGEEIIVDDRQYHTIKEVKNGLGPAPIKTEQGWLQLAHGVRNTAAGLRYVLYMFLTDLNEPWKKIASPAGYFLAPEGEERIGDVSNVVFSNGWVKRKNGDVLIYYGSSDTRTHVVTTTVDKLLDYVLNTPPDGLRSAESVKTRNALIEKNLKLLKTLKKK